VSAGQARLFVALELPAEVRSVLESWSRGHVGRMARVRLVEPESLHVTLCFVGSRPAGEIDAIAAACGGVSGLPPAALTLGAARWLPPRRPRVLTVTLADARERLAVVRATLAAALQDGGFYEPETRPFLAHVTVARVPHEGRPRRDTRVAHDGRPRREDLPAPEAVRFTGDTVTLYRSHLGRGPAHYEALSRVTLSG
jgi:2'-5' RNA ligase